MTEVTVGLDIGTSSVKAIAADGDGNVIASARVPHEYRVPAPARLEHDATVAWRDGPLAALAALGVGDHDLRGVSVSAMVPSLTAVDANGMPLLPGLLYGDERGRADAEPGSPATGLEFGGFVRWMTDEAPGAHGLWPAQAVANYALAGAAAIDITTASTAYPVYDFTDWDADLAAGLGARVEQFPRVLSIGAEAGRLAEGGAALASGCIDAFAEELVAGADQPGDVLVLLGTTLIVWVVAAGTGDVPGWVVLPNPAAGQTRVGGPSNAGGLFCDWVGRMVGPVPSGVASPQPARVPVWAPYPRGERSPINNPDLRAVLDGLDLTHDGAAVRRAAFEASGFVVRRAIDATRRRARLRTAEDRRNGWWDPSRRLAPSSGRCHGTAGGLRRGARRGRARVGVARVDGGGSRRAHGDARRAAVGTCGSDRGSESRLVGAGGRTLRAISSFDGCAHGADGNTMTSPG